MDTKKQFLRWLAAEYPQLHQRLTDTDSLHDACITVYELRNLLPDEFSSLLLRAYNMHRRRYVQYIFRFIVPDPRFWLFQDENEEDTAPDLQQAEQEKEQQEKQNHMKATAFLQWLRAHSTEAELIIFRMFYFEHLELRDIARITGKTKHQILEIIERKCEEYRAARERKATYQPQQSVSSRQPCMANKHTTATAPAICFRISKQGHYQIIPTRKCIEYLGLKVGTRLFFQQHNNRFFLAVLPSDAAIYTCTIRRGTRPYNLQAQDREVVREILKITGATNSVTLPVKPTVTQKNYWFIDINNPLKIN